MADTHRVRASAPNIDDEIERYLVALRAGDRSGFTALFQALAGKVAGYVRGRGVPDAEDVVNEVFLGAFRNFDTFDGDAARFRSWIFGIASNKVGDWHRNRDRRPAVIGNPDSALRRIKGGDAELEAIDQLLSADVVALLDDLSEDQRDVLLLRVIADLSLRQTAEAVGKPTGAVKSLQHRALATLRREIVDEAVSKWHDPATTSVR